MVHKNQNTIFPRDFHSIRHFSQILCVFKKLILFQNDNKKLINFFICNLCVSYKSQNIFTRMLFEPEVTTLSKLMSETHHLIENQQHTAHLMSKVFSIF